MLLSCKAGDTILPKAGTFSQNYHPISLLPAMSNIIKRIILFRDFRHLACRAVCFQTSSLYRTANPKTSGIGLKRTLWKYVSFDVYNAFERVKHDRLINKIGQLGYPANIIHLRVTVRSDFSDYKEMEAGVLQEAALSLELFCIFTAGIPWQCNVVRGRYSYWCQSWHADAAF